MLHLISRIAAAAASCIAFGASAGEIPRYEHIFVIIAENKSFDQIVGSPDAPRLNSLAKEYGLATQFYAETHPSEGNYVAMLAGDTFGIRDDDAWYCVRFKRDPFCRHSALPGYVSHSLSARSLMDQLADAKLTWKGYFEDLPASGSLVIFDPSSEHPDPGRPAELYAAKHNGFVNFERVRNDPEIAKNMVPLEELAKDLAANAVPNYAQIILNQCNDMHGLHPKGGPRPPADFVIERGRPEGFGALVRRGNAATELAEDLSANTMPILNQCDDMPGLHPSGSAELPADFIIERERPLGVGTLIRRGDAAIGAIVDAIMAAPVWAGEGNVAIVITWDEDGYNTAGPQGCCGYDPASAGNPGGGHIPTIVVTNHGPRQVEDNEHYNHYSLLRTVEEAFGISEYLGFAGGIGVKPMTPLFAVERSSASAAKPGG